MWERACGNGRPREPVLFLPKPRAKPRGKPKGPSRAPLGQLLHPPQPVILSGAASCAKRTIRRSRRTPALPGTLGEKWALRSFFLSTLKDSARYIRSRRGPPHSVTAVRRYGILDTHRLPCTRTPSAPWGWSSSRQMQAPAFPCR